MKNIKNSLLIAGLLLGMSGTYAAAAWEPTGPTVLDVLSSRISKMRMGPRVQIADAGSLEDQLISAVKNGNLKEVESFIAQGAGFEAGDRNHYEHKRALMIAIEKGYTDIAITLINAGADVNAEENLGRTVLAAAVRAEEIEIVKLIMQKGDVKKEWNFDNIFVYAAATGNNEMVKALLVGDVQIDHKVLTEAYSIAQETCSREAIDAIKRLQAKTRK